MYSDPGSGDIVQGYLLPVLLLACFVYLFTPVGATLLGAMGLCIAGADLFSESLFQSILLPAAAVGFFVLFVIWAWKSGYTFYSSPDVTGTSGGDGNGC